MKIADQLRKLGFSDAMIATATIHGKPVVAIDGPEKTGFLGFRSKWEYLYAQELGAQKAAGEILAWFYEAVTFQLTEPCVVDGKKVRSVRYTPDFVVWLPDGTMRAIEIKGYRRTDSINRFKAAKDKFRQIEFVMLRREGGAFIQMPY